MEKLNDLDVRLTTLEHAVALLLRISPNADVLLQGQEELAAELKAQGAPDACFNLVRALRNIHVTPDRAERLPGSAASTDPSSPSSPPPPAPA